MSRPFPDDPFLKDLWEPWPMEGEIHDLPVDGEIPLDLNGTLYRNGPNPQFAPRGAYHFFTGDGMIHAFRIEDGKVHYKNRWVRTPCFELERKAGEALYGGFNRSLDDPRTRGVPGGPANTNVVWHAGRLLALVEGGLPPVELDPDTLETKGIGDFEGALVRPIDPKDAAALGIEAPDGMAPGIFTAHPKIDPESGELLGFGYSAIPPYLIYYTVSPEGKLVRSEEIDIPFPSMIHDFIITREHVIFPVFPATLRMERALAGESAIGWEPELGTHVGVMPRDGGNDDVVWLETNPSYVFHSLNAHSAGRHVIAELAQYERLPIPGAGNDLTLGAVPAQLVRWVIDLDGGTVKEEPIDDRAIEFPRIDERFAGLDYRYGYAASDGDPLTGFESILRYDVTTGDCRRHAFGRGSTTSEPIFAPRGKGEGEGYLLAVVYRADEKRSDLVVVDAENPEAKPLATAKLPHRVPGGFHGNWRPTE